MDRLSFQDAQNLDREMGMEPEVPGQSEVGQAQVILGLGVAREEKTEEQPENDKQGMNCEGFRGERRFLGVKEIC